MVNKEKLSEVLSILKTTAIGGLFFLLPIIFIGFLLGKLVQAFATTITMIDSYMPFHSAKAYSVLVVIAFLLTLLACFTAGFVAKRSIARRFNETIEKYLLLAFPRYAIVKGQLSGKFGADVHKQQFNPVFIEGSDNLVRLGIEVERSSEQMLTVYIPGSPDPWTGSIAIVHQSRVRRAPIDFLAAFTCMEHLGKDLQATTKYSSFSTLDSTRTDDTK
jgi:uncharacterized membrane protein